MALPDLSGLSFIELQTVIKDAQLRLQTIQKQQTREAQRLAKIREQHARTQAENRALLQEFKQRAEKENISFEQFTGVKVRKLPPKPRGKKDRVRWGPKGPGVSKKPLPEEDEFSESPAKAQSELAKAFKPDIDWKDLE